MKTPATLCTIAALAALATAGAANAATELVVNGSFENNVISSPWARQQRDGLDLVGRRQLGL